MDIKRVAVIGAGTMGNGIAQVFAQCGFDVYLRDVKTELVERGLAAIESSLARLVKKEKIRESESRAARERIRSGVELEGAADADFVVEAILEDADAKRAVFRELDGLTRPEVILASNTSSISDHQARRHDETSRPLHRDALHEPRSGDGARRDHPRSPDVG